MPAESPPRGKRSLGIDVLVYGFARIAPAIFSLLGTALFTRIFDVDAYGRFAIALAIVIPLTTLLSAWLEQPTARYFAEAHAEGWSATYLGVIRRSITALSLAAITAFFVTFAVQSSLPLESTTPFVIGGILWFWGQSHFSVTLALLAASGRPLQYASMKILMAGLALLLPLLLIFSVTRNAAMILVGQGLARLAVFPLFIGPWLSLPVLQRNARAVPEKDPLPPGASAPSEGLAALRKFVRYGSPMTLWVFAAGLLDVGDRVLLGLLLGEGSAGVYAANAQVVTAAATMLSGAFITAVFPRVMDAWADRRPEDAQRIITVATHAFALVGITFLAGTFLLGQPILTTLLADGYDVSLTVIMPIAFGVLLYGAANLGQKSLELHHKTWDMVGFALAAAAFNVVTNMLLIPVGGIAAAAWTTLASYLLYVLLVFLRARNLLAWRLPVRPMVSMALIAATSIMITMLLESALSAWILLPSITWLTVRLALFLTSYTALLAAFEGRAIMSLVRDLRGGA